MIRRCLIFSAVAATVTALHDPARVALMALGLAKIRAANPSMFDGKLAAENVEAVLTDNAEWLATL